MKVQQTRRLRARPCNSVRNVRVDDFGAKFWFGLVAQVVQVLVLVEVVGRR